LRRACIELLRALANPGDDKIPAGDPVSKTIIDARLRDISAGGGCIG